jgi:hypothetical protein
VLAFHSYIQLFTRPVHRTWQSKLACQPAGHRHVSAKSLGNPVEIPQKKLKKNACVFLRSDAFLLRFSTPAVREYFESLGLDISVPWLTQDESALPCCASKPSPMTGSYPAQHSIPRTCCLRVAQPPVCWTHLVPFFKRIGRGLRTHRHRHTHTDHCHQQQNTYSALFLNLI